MGAILAQFNVADMSVQQYDQILSDLGGPGAGCIYHVAAVQPQGMMVIDLWESKEALDEFGQRLMPILQKNRVTPQEPTIMPVHNMAGAPVAVH